MLPATYNNSGIGLDGAGISIHTVTLRKLILEQSSRLNNNIYKIKLFNRVVLDLFNLTTS